MKILHISIPKNAGTFIANKIASNFDADKEIYVMDLKSITLQETVLGLSKIIDSYDFIAGHFPLSIFKGSLHRFDLILSSYRNPWYRAVSYFQYERKRQPHMFESDIQSFAGFCEKNLFGNVGTRNHQCSFLGDINTVESAVTSIEENKIAVIPVETVDLSLRAVFKRHSLSYPEASNRNSSESEKVFHPMEDIKLYNRILSWFDGDYALYDYLNYRRLNRDV